MGCKFSTKKISQKDSKRNKDIEIRLQSDYKKEQNKTKIILLGTGESGKSTLIKQLSLLFSNGFDEDDFVTYRDTIRSNILFHMNILLQEATKLKIKLEEQNQLIAENFLKKEYCLPNDLNPETTEQINLLWKDPNIRKVYDLRSSFSLPDSCSYYFDEIDRIVAQEYKPTSKDILLCRIPTTGINSIDFQNKDLLWEVIDVGGQRSERRKWIDHFYDVDFLIYIVATSEYDQKLFEDLTVNRMEESLTMFQSIMKIPAFANKPCVLLLNKIDLFEEKIKKISIKSLFPEYLGDDDPTSCLKFIEQKFFDLVDNSHQIFSISCCATETDKMRDVFDQINKYFAQNSKKI